MGWKEFANRFMAGIVVAICFVSFPWFRAQAIAQDLPPGLDGSRQGIQAQQMVAFSGEPWGVASLMIPIGQVEQGVVPRVVITEEDGRVFYPSMVMEALEITRIERQNDRRIGQGALMQRLRTAIQSGREAIQPPQGIRISFLFRGTEPLKVKLSGDLHQAFVIKADAFASKSCSTLANLVEGLWHASSAAVGRQRLSTFGPNVSDLHVGSSHESPHAGASRQKGTQTT